MLKCSFVKIEKLKMEMEMLSFEDHFVTGTSYILFDLCWFYIIGCK